MENLTSLLQFLQEEHENIKSVLFKNYMLPNQVLGVITLKGKLFVSTDSRSKENLKLLSLINLFNCRFGARLHAEFAPDDLKLFVVAKLNK